MVAMTAHRTETYSTLQMAGQLFRHKHQRQHKARARRANRAGQPGKEGQSPRRSRKGQRQAGQGQQGSAKHFGEIVMRRKRFCKRQDSSVRCQRWRGYCCCLLFSSSTFFNLFLNASRARPTGTARIASRIKIPKKDRKSLRNVKSAARVLAHTDTHKRVLAHGNLFL